MIEDFLAMFPSGENSMFFYIGSITFVLLSLLSKRFFLLTAITSMPGTFMHEFAHWLFALFSNARPTGFTVIPSKKNSYLGQVTVSNPTWYNSSIVGIAPLFLLVIAYYLAGSIETSSEGRLIIYGYVLSSMVRSSIPSTQDLRVFFSGIVVPIALTALFYSKEIYTFFSSL